MDNIRQIMPATGWRVVSVSYDAGECTVREEPVVCFALLEPPYAEREDGPEQLVVPMIRDRGTYPSKSMGMCDIVIGDAAYALGPGGDRHGTQVLARRTEQVGRGQSGGDCPLDQAYIPPNAR
jgi:hypothetical protein